MGELFFYIIWKMITAPFVFAGLAIRAVWEHIVKPLNQGAADKSARKLEEGLLQRTQSAEMARREAREKQLAVLRAAGPQAPPERMRATIHINEIKKPAMTHQRVKHFLAEDTWISVETGEETRWSVDMLLEMSETERAIIQENQLKNIILEDTSTFTERDLQAMETQYAEEVAATKDIWLKEAVKQSTQAALASLKEHRDQSRVGDYLVFPFSREFRTSHEAKLYADKLKTKILPSIRQLLDAYESHSSAETIEF